MRIISNRKHCEEITYVHTFQLTNAARGSGFSFPCDRDGKVNIEKLAEQGRINYIDCINGKLPVTDMGVVEQVNRWTEDAMGLCDECGLRVSLRGFTNTCDCGADYNMSGQLLAPREQWGEETGESYSDITMGDFFSDRY